LQETCSDGEHHEAARENADYKLIFPKVPAQMTQQLADANNGSPQEFVKTFKYR